LARQKQYHGESDSGPRTRRTNTGNPLGGSSTHYRARAPSPEPEKNRNSAIFGDDDELNDALEEASGPMTTPRKNLPEGGPAWLARQKQYHGDCDSGPRTRRTNTGNALGGGTTHYRARAPSPEPVDRTTEPEVCDTEPTGPPISDRPMPALQLNKVRRAPTDIASYSSRDRRKEEMEMQEALEEEKAEEVAAEAPSPQVSAQQDALASYRAQQARERRSVDISKYASRDRRKEEMEMQEASDAEKAEEVAAASQKSEAAVFASKPAPFVPVRDPVSLENYAQRESLCQHQQKSRGREIPRPVAPAPQADTPPVALPPPVTPALAPDAPEARETTLSRSEMSRPVTSQQAMVLTSPHEHGGHMNSWTSGRQMVSVSPPVHRLELWSGKGTNTHVVASGYIIRYDPAL